MGLGTFNLGTPADFEPIPMDRYTVQIKGVTLKEVNKYMSVEKEEVFNYQFVILDDKPMPEKVNPETGKNVEGGTTRGRFLWHKCRIVAGSRSWLIKLATAANGHDLTKEEMKAFDPESILGKQVDVIVEQSENKDHTQTYSNIVAFSKTIKKLELFEEVPGDQPVMEKSTRSTVPAGAGTVPQVAPGEDPDIFAKNLEDEGKVGKKVGDADQEVSEEDDEEVALLKAKIKLAKKKGEDEDEIAVLEAQLRVAEKKAKK